MVFLLYVIEIKWIYIYIKFFSTENIRRNIHSSLLRRKHGHCDGNFRRKGKTMRRIVCDGNNPSQNGLAYLRRKFRRKFEFPSQIFFATEISVANCKLRRGFATEILRRFLRRNPCFATEFECFATDFSVAKWPVFL